jgi:hypothetical protein
VYKVGYEVTGMILLQAHMYTDSLLRGVSFEVLSLCSYALGPVMLPLLGTFLELLLWNSFQCHHIFCLLNPEIFVPVRQTSVLETARSYLGLNQGNRVGVPFE